MAKRFITMAGLFLVVSTFMLSSSAMAAQKSNSPTPAGGAMLQPSIQFTEISINFDKTDIVIAYEPSKMRLICKFSDLSPIPQSTHSVDFYIDNNKVFDKDKDFDHTQFKGNTALMDIPIPAVGTYTFKCVVDSKSISLPFRVAKFFYETCRPTVTVHMVPDRHKLTQDLSLSIPSVQDSNNPIYSLNVPNAPDQILSLTGSTIVPPGNEVKCIYGSALFYRKECKQANKVINQHKYECAP